MAESGRILVVDDTPDLLMIVSKRLSLAGYEVITAEDGQAGLMKAQQEKPDLVLLDLMLPKLNGYEVCSMLKQDSQFQTIPIVIFTAKTQERDEQLAMECGADAFIRKPFNPVELLEQIKGLLALKKTQGESS